MNEKRGKLKIFFGYSAGVGKTYTMLQEAHALNEAGVDVVAGYVEPHQRPETLALFEGLPQIPALEVQYKDIVLYEFDIDAAIERKPSVILVDELAHTNAKGCRNLKRYQDVEELLKRGINVYTTINVQHIEGLHDIVQAITGVAVRERIPDSVFDGADKVELIDIEPEDLMRRLNEGKVYKTAQAKRALSNFFTKENLVALREIALRRTADRVNITVEKNKFLQNKSGYFTDEHILTCISSSPTNQKVIRTAAKMAEAFHGQFTALFVETSDFNEMPDSDKTRLKENIRLAEQLGAKIATVYGDDVPYQVALYATASSVSKIVLGRSPNRTFLGFVKQNYVDRLTAFAPEIETFIIPDKAGFETTVKRNLIKIPSFSFLDTLKSLLCLFAATGIGFLFEDLDFSESNIITVYILATLFTAVITEGKIYSLVSSVLAVLMFNFFFTDPIFTLQVNNLAYIMTFVVMFLSALITSTFTKIVKEQGRQSSQRAHRTEVLLETSQKLQQCKDKSEMFLESVQQINRLLDCDAFIYPVKNNKLGDPISAPDSDISAYLTHQERAVAQWVLLNNKHAGATTNTMSNAKCLYMSIRTGDKVLAVIGIVMESGILDVFEKNLLISMLSECALAIEKENLLESKNEASVRAEKEQMRSSLLRAISHDLRTPLTGIAGCSEFLVKTIDKLDNETIKSMLTDISQDAAWLSGIVENLLNMTRIQDGRLSVNKKAEMVDEVISEAVSKVIKGAGKHEVKIEKNDEMLFIPMDSQLMMQVIINLLDNAFIHTRDDCSVEIKYGKEGGSLFITVTDDGGGIADEVKIFEPSSLPPNSRSDKRRGMGLGLSICKAMIEAHGGKISAQNNNLGGSTFKILIPANM